MPYITSFERKAMNRARQQDVLRVLTSRFGKPPEALVAAVQEVKEEEKLLSLLDEVGRVPDVAAFERVLAGDESEGDPASGQPDTAAP